MSYFASKIKELRTAIGLSQRAIAQRLGITHANYQRYESDKNYPSINKLLEMAKLFNVPLDALFYDIPYKQRPLPVLDMPKVIPKRITPKDAIRLLTKVLKDKKAW